MLRPACFKHCLSVAAHLVFSLTVCIPSLVKHRDHVISFRFAMGQYCSFKVQILPRDLLVTMATDVIAWPFAKVHLVAQRTRRA